MKYLKLTGVVLIFMILANCKKPYAPAAVTAPNSYLVVEGVINTGADSTFIKLSKTVNLSSGVTTNPVTGATVTVEGEQNESFPLKEIAGGSYAVPGLNLGSTKKYRIRISTSDKKSYVSDFAAAMVTPVIDSIGYIPGTTGIQIYSNAHDDNNSTHYYRWEYAETWAFHAKYDSRYMTNGIEIVDRPPDKFIYSCFGNDKSSTILLGSSAKLSKDVIYQNPVVFIPSSAEKIETRYSILLTQYALSADAYHFWVNLKKNTEQLGSIFDAQPSNINGNVHNVNDAKEVVVGYISVSTVQTKRVFIDKSELPTTYKTVYPYDCPLDSSYFKAPYGSYNAVAANLIPLSSVHIPVAQFFVPPAPALAGYLSAGEICVDCTLRGTKKQPAFWK